MGQVKQVHKKPFEQDAHTAQLYLGYTVGVLSCLHRTAKETSQIPAAALRKEKEGWMGGCNGLCDGGGKEDFRIELRDTVCTTMMDSVRVRIYGTYYHANEWMCKGGVLLSWWTLSWVPW